MYELWIFFSISLLIFAFLAGLILFVCNFLELKDLLARMSRRTSQSRYHVPLETWKEDEVFSNSADDLRDLAEMLKKDSETNDTSNGKGLSQAGSVTNRSSRSSLIR